MACTEAPAYPRSAKIFSATRSSLRFVLGPALSIDIPDGRGAYGKRQTETRESRNSGRILLGAVSECARHAGKGVIRLTPDATKRTWAIQGRLSVQLGLRGSSITRCVAGCTNPKPSLAGSWRRDLPSSTSAVVQARSHSHWPGGSVLRVA